MSISVNSSKVSLMLDKTIKATPSAIKNALSMTAQQGINLILDRTEAGRGIYKQFAPYHPNYAKWKLKSRAKTKSGKSWTGGGATTSTVNLQLTNDMLSAMQISASRGYSYVIRFGRKFAAQKAYYNQQKRPFFGFNEKEKVYLSRFFRKAIMK